MKKYTVLLIRVKNEVLVMKPLLALSVMHRNLIAQILSAYRNVLLICMHTGTPTRKYLVLCILNFIISNMQ